MSPSGLHQIHSESPSSHQGGLRSSGIPHEGYANPVMNNRPRFHSNMPVSELTKRVTRAIEASDISSAPPVVRNHGWGDDNKDELTPRPDPYNAQGLEGSWTRKETKCTIAERWLGP